MNNNFFDKSVREKLQGHEAPVPADAWANIQKGKKKRRPLPFFWLLALLLCTGAGLYLYKYGKGNDTAFAPDHSTSLSRGDTAEIKKISRENILSKENNNEIILKNKTANTNRNNAATPVQPAHAAVVPSFTKNRNHNNAPAAIINHRGNNKNNKATSTVTVNGEEGKTVFKKNRRSTGGRWAMQVTAPNVNDTVAASEVFKKDGAVFYEDSILFAGKQGTNKVAINERQKLNELSKNSIRTDSTAVPVIQTTARKKKKNKTGVAIDLSIAAFMPAANKTGISSVNRTITSPMHKAEFEANKVRIRLQPSAGFNLLLFKTISPKLSVGTGISYQVIKEYIHLSGQEVNTNYALVKRLNGGVLTDDTVTTVTKGIRNIDAVNSYNLLSIPVSFRYRLLQRSQWTMELQGGIDINLQSKYKNSIGGQLMPQLANAGNTKRNTTVGTGFNAGVRMSRRVGKSYLIYAAPYLQLNPKTLYLKEMLAPAAIHKAGISIGMSYGL